MNPPKKKQNLKKTIKYLSICHDPKIISKIIQSSPDSVTKSICNAALNAARGDVVLTKKQKKILASHRSFVSALINEKEPIAKKKKILVQKGGGVIALVIPALLSAVLGSLGTALFK